MIARRVWPGSLGYGRRRPFAGLRAAGRRGDGGNRFRERYRDSASDAASRFFWAAR